MRAILSARTSVIFWWFVRIVGDVPGVEVLLDAADAVLQPRVPGMAQRRASGFGSRTNGWKPSGLGAELDRERRRIASTSGICHGSAALAR